MSVGVARLREDAEALRRGAIAKRDDPSAVDRAIEVEARRRSLTAEVDDLRRQRNVLSGRIEQAVRGGADPRGPDVAAIRAESSALGERIGRLEEEAATVAGQLDDLLLRIPNPPDPDVPVGGAEANASIRAWGEPLPHAADGFERRPHWELAQSLGILDLERAAKITGSGFAVWRGAGAALQRALIDLMLGIHTREHGLTEVWAPALVNEASARGTGQLPDKEAQMYVVTADDLYLVPTAEVPVTNLHRDEILEAADLPLRYVAYTPCFRREAGAAGKDTRGLLRVHQFDKVEMVFFERPADSDAALEELTRFAEVVLQRLGLAYRVVMLATGEMGVTQAKTYDLEVWAPGVERWLEVSSCSNFRDYQARRMRVRFRPKPGAEPEILHTLNGSGVALARTVAALLETYQQPDGSVAVPDALRDALGTDRLTGSPPA
jgi:seryl-tRNA synthetase